MEDNWNSSKGFTLIELLVVMGIIIILSAMIIPRVGGARSKALQISCSSNIRSIDRAMQLYVQDYSGYVCVGEDPSTHLPNGDMRSIAGALYYQGGDKTGGITAFETWICPALKSETHLPPLADGYKAPLVALNGDTGTGKSSFIDYGIILNFDGASYIMPNFKIDPEENACLTELTPNHAGRNVGFINGTVKYLTDDELVAYFNTTKNGVKNSKNITGGTGATPGSAAAFVTARSTGTSWNSGKIAYK